jgi:hypothetical protein
MSSSLFCIQFYILRVHECPRTVAAVQVTVCVHVVQNGRFFGRRVGSGHARVSPDFGPGPRQSVAPMYTLACPLPNGRGGRPSQCAWQTTASAPARARGLASAPASSDARGERGKEMGVVRATREERRARRKVHACPRQRILRNAPRAYSPALAPIASVITLSCPNSPQSRAALRAQHAPVAIQKQTKANY